MAEPARPYTPDQLAERWQCSAETIRNLVKSKQLPGFRCGRMIRIPRQSVEEYEQCLKSPSENCAVATASRGERTENDGVISLRHAPEKKPRQRP
ncbi:helix-turn-helix domain-containing protein [Paracoccus alkanivorans]|uniref:DNA-binding protein n=1 Tax=Paracoccus alkanivorans TaxID=2116655 RepID=A0A3M0M8A2_9RHOB|nr:DNA-binding protein [Paracoccus alkanivorans]